MVTGPMHQSDGSDPETNKVAFWVLQSASCTQGEQLEQRGFSIGGDGAGAWAPATRPMRSPAALGTVIGTRSIEQRGRRCWSTTIRARISEITCVLLLSRPKRAVRSALFRANHP